MIILAAILLGAVIGWLRAGRLGGNRADRIQYAAVHAIGFAMLGLFISVWLSRVM